jgi:lysine 2,3-aminomutase
MASTVSVGGQTTTPSDLRDEPSHLMRGVVRWNMCDMIPNAEHWRVSVWEAQELQHAIMGYLPGYATPRIVCDVPYVGKRWVHQLAEYDRELGISYWTKNYRTGIELEDPEALDRRYPYYDPISTLGDTGQKWWTDQT